MNFNTKTSGILENVCVYTILLALIVFSIFLAKDIMSPEILFSLEKAILAGVMAFCNLVLYIITGRTFDFVMFLLWILNIVILVPLILEKDFGISIEHVVGTIISG